MLRTYMLVCMIFASLGCSSDKTPAPATDQDEKEMHINPEAVGYTLATRGPVYLQYAVSCLEQGEDHGTVEINKNRMGLNPWEVLQFHAAVEWKGGIIAPSAPWIVEVPAYQEHAARTLLCLQMPPEEFGYVQ